MSSITDFSVTIQTSSESVPSTPCWLGEVSLITHYLRHQGVFALIEERVLSTDVKYQSYCRRVGWHLVPGVF